MVCQLISCFGDHVQISYQSSWAEKVKGNKKKNLKHTNVLLQLEVMCIASACKLSLTSACPEKDYVMKQHVPYYSCSLQF